NFACRFNASVVVYIGIAQAYISQMVFVLENVKISIFVFLHIPLRLEKELQFVIFILETTQIIGGNRCTSCRLYFFCQSCVGGILIIAYFSCVKHYFRR